MYPTWYASIRTMERSYGLALVSRQAMKTRGLLEWTADPDQSFYTKGELKAAKLRKAQARQEKRLRRGLRRS